MKQAIEQLVDPLSPAEATVVANANDHASLQVAESDNRTLGEIGNGLVNEWAQPEKEQGVEWPLQSLQQLVGNLSDELCIIAAQPSVGKTAFAVQLAVHTSKAGNIVSFASLESRREKIVQRMIAQIGDVDTLKLRNKRGHPADFARARAAAERIAKLPLRMHDDPMTVDALRAWAMREKANGTKLFIIDNLKHIRMPNFKNRFDAFAALSLEIKALRDDTGIPFVVLHHLNNEDKLAQSMDIERDADIVIMMQRADEQNHFVDENGWVSDVTINFEVAKNREGRVGTIRAVFRKDRQRFELA